MKRVIYLCLWALMFVPMACTFAADKVPVKVTGMYTDMAYNAEGGDVLGTEIFVVNTNHGYYVVFQVGEGQPAVPVIVPAEVSGTSIRFVLPSSIVGGTFTGIISPSRLTGSFSSNHQIIHLKRKVSYWQ